MAAPAISMVLGYEIAKALGLDPDSKWITHMRLEFPARGAVVLEVRYDVRKEQTQELAHLLARYELVPKEDA